MTVSDLRFVLKTHYTRSRALVIGIDNYAVASPLSYAVSDALGVRDALLQEFGFDESDLTLLTNADATRSRIEQAFHRFTRGDVDSDERIVVFFAGHGTTRTGYRGEVGFLVPHDGDPNNLETLIRWDYLTRNSELVRAKHLLFIMDACYGGLALSRDLQPGATRFLKDMMLRYSRQVLTAGKANEVVADAGGPLPNHSVFTGHLIEGMRGSAASSTGIITAAGLMAYVYSKVASDRNSNQTPHYGHFEGDGDFVFKAQGLSALESEVEADRDELLAVPYPDRGDVSESIDSKVKRIKNLLASETGSIELHDFLIYELRHFLSMTAQDNFPTSGAFSDEELMSRITRYEEAVSGLCLLLACVSYWGRAAHMGTLQKVIARSMDRPEHVGGLAIWIALRYYPMILEIYSGGIAAVDGERYDSLAQIFNTPVQIADEKSTHRTFAGRVGRAISQLNQANVFKKIPGHERHHVPMSEYLFKVLQPKLDDALFLGKDYENTFDRFEVLFALAVADANKQSQRNPWGPVGRFGWKHHTGDGPLKAIVEEAKSQKERWVPLKAGLFGGDYVRFEAVAEEYISYIDRLSMW